MERDYNWLETNDARFQSLERQDLCHCSDVGIPAGLVNRINQFFTAAGGTESFPNHVASDETVHICGLMRIYALSHLRFDLRYHLKSADENLSVGSAFGHNFRKFRGTE